MKPTCWIVRRKLPPLAAGELNDAEVRRIRAHLGRCPACARELALMESALGALHSVGSEVKWGDSAGAEAWQRIRPRIETPKRQRPALRPVLVFAAATAAVAVTAILAFTIFPLGVERPALPDLAQNTPSSAPALTGIQPSLLTGESLPVIQEYGYDAILTSDAGEWGRY